MGDELRRQREERLNMREQRLAERERRLQAKQDLELFMVKVALIMSTVVVLAPLGYLIWCMSNLQGGSFY